MRTSIWNLIFVVIVQVLLGTTALAQDGSSSDILDGAADLNTFYNQWFHTNLSYNADWVPQEIDEDYLLLSLKHKELPATFNVFGYSYASEITINAFQQRRQTAGYDGWISVGQRPASEEEKKRAAADEGFLSVYSKKDLKPGTVEVRNRLVAEYYFLKGDKKGYVLSLRVPKHEMKAVQSAYRKLVDSFWIGEDQRPTDVYDVLSSYDWVSKGQNPQNQNTNLSTYRFFDEAPKLLWSQDIEGLASGKDQGLDPVFEDGVMYIATQGYLRALSLYDGEEIWTFKTRTPIEHQLLINRHQLYFFANYNNRYYLYALNARTGALLYKIPVPSSDRFEAIAGNQRIYLSDGRELSVWMAKDGKRDWAVDFPMPKGMYPIIDKEQIVGVDSNNRLRAYDLQSSRLLWVQALNWPLIKPPIFTQSYVLGLSQVPGGDLVVWARDRENGTQVWEEHIEESFEQINELQYKDNILFIDGSNNGQRLILAVDSQTGGVQWRHPLEISDTENASSFISRDVYWVSRDTTERPVTLYPINIKTGQTVDPLSIELNWLPETLKDRRFIPYKDRCVIIQRGPQKTSIYQFKSHNKKPNVKK